jgi:glycosyltransferase involved in cell wall biosynthesis
MVDNQNEYRPLVSVVTPSYNALPFLRETIESVRNQDYPWIEHIVVDGNSEDGTQEVLRAYPDLIWISEADKGQSDALNKGFRRASGEIIGWLNADDNYQSGAVSVAVEYLVRHPDADLVHSDLLVIDEHSQPLGISKSRSFELIAHLFENHIKQPTVFMRRSVVEALGGVDKNLHYVMDRELWLRAGRRFQMHYLDGHILAQFRKCPGTKSYEQTPLFHEEWLGVLRCAVEESLLDVVPNSVVQRAIRHTKASLHLAHMMRAIDRRNPSKVLKYMLLAIVEDPRVAANRGTWLLTAQGLLGLDRNRKRKYR